MTTAVRSCFRYCVALSEGGFSSLERRRVRNGWLSLLQPRGLRLPRPK
jgi:hypothetical protein